MIGCGRTVLDDEEDRYVPCHSPIVGEPVWCLHPSGIGRSPDHEIGYCAAHGGHAGAVSEAARCWDAIAPARVGSHGDVERAGQLVLRTPELAGVVREIDQGRRWIAATGLGSLMTHLVGSHDTREEAVRAVCVAVLALRAETVRAIREARGGTLAWGALVTEDAPIELHLPSIGQGSWDDGVPVRVVPIDEARAMETPQGSTSDQRRAAMIERRKRGDV